MEPLVREIVKGLLDISTKEMKPLVLVEEGVKLLQDKPFNKNTKKEILKAIIQQIAYGADGVCNTFDDRLSPETLNILLMIIETDTVDYIIDGIVANFKKLKVKTLFNKCGVLIRWSPSH